MELNKFLTFYKKPKSVKMINDCWTGFGGIVNDYYGPIKAPLPLQVPWWFRYQLAEDLEGVDFGCAFKDGKCVAERHDLEVIRNWRKDTGYLSQEINFCCSSCYLTIGNLTTLPNDIIIIEEVANLFDPDGRGFWRKNVGCILPHRYRSTMCLTGRCYFHPCSKETLRKIYRLTNIRSEWRRYQEHAPP